MGGEGGCDRLDTVCRDVGFFRTQHPGVAVFSLPQRKSLAARGKMIDVQDTIAGLWTTLLGIPALMRMYKAIYDVWVPVLGFQVADAAIQWTAGLAGILAVSTVFAVVELTVPDSLAPWRLQEAKRGAKLRRRDPREYFAGLQWSLLNLFVVNGALTVGASWYVWPWRRGTTVYEDMRLPATPWELLLHIAVFALCVEVVFYTMHRLSHSEVLYREIHSLHHTFKTPSAWAAVAAHPLEHVFVNIAAVAAGPMVMGAHPALAAAWYTFATATTAFSHSGYTLPLMPSAKAHDWHHEAVTECYGVLGFCDTLLRTNTRFLAGDAKATDAASAS